MPGRFRGARNLITENGFLLNINIRQKRKPAVKRRSAHYPGTAQRKSTDSNNSNEPAGAPPAIWKVIQVIAASERQEPVNSTRYYKTRCLAPALTVQAAAERSTEIDGVNLDLITFHGPLNRSSHCGVLGIWFFCPLGTAIVGFERVGGLLIPSASSFRTLPFTSTAKAVVEDVGAQVALACRVAQLASKSRPVQVPAKARAVANIKTPSNVSVLFISFLPPY